MDLTKPWVSAVLVFLVIMSGFFLSMPLVLSPHFRQTNQELLVNQVLDGHQFIVRRNGYGSPIHHPDCHCKNGE